MDRLPNALILFPVYSYAFFAHAFFTLAVNGKIGQKKDGGSNAMNRSLYLF